jgi:hypothetical protein
LTFAIVTRVSVVVSGSCRDGRAAEHKRSPAPAPAEPSPAKPSPAEAADDSSFEHSQEAEQKAAAQPIFSTNRIAVKSLRPAPEEAAAAEPAQAQAGVTRLGQVRMPLLVFMNSF